MSQAEARLRILEAATRLFAERGFEQTRVREIALHAKVNVSAINYYYGSKDALYARALEKGACENGLYSALNEASPDGEAQADFARILAWEIVKPHGPSTAIVRAAMERETTAARRLIQRLVNRPLPKEEERFAAQIMVCVLLFGHFIFDTHQNWRPLLEAFVLRGAGSLPILSLSGDCTGE